MHHFAAAPCAPAPCTSSFRTHSCTKAKVLAQTRVSGAQPQDRTTPDAQQHHVLALLNTKHCMSSDYCGKAILVQNAQSPFRPRCSQAMRAPRHELDNQRLGGVRTLSSSRTRLMRDTAS